MAARTEQNEMSKMGLLVVQAQQNPPGASRAPLLTVANAFCGLPLSPNPCKRSADLGLCLFFFGTASLDFAFPYSTPSLGGLEGCLTSFYSVFPLLTLSGLFHVSSLPTLLLQAVISSFFVLVARRRFLARCSFRFLRRRSTSVTLS